ncbi:hypothetical protein [Bradyrhizobium sp. AUGA SZCCT0160]|uniref:hypothetical protein n=1 Tax=Bradyrhizobium sp. AUGA SZCCT0160 TaxID=2807662 RepID=UPI001BABE57E|nr:hypothetical protein [Bradyrhizobium sp. AUGA SZCCT0160]MBR1193193.1 hypothetical protein [Bradyrhizobium sp. AUGA SZCCT0160]
MASIRPSDGEYVVIDGRWSFNRYEIRQIIKLTEQMYFYKGEGSGRERRSRLDEVIFSSADKAACEKLAEKLKSSDALRDDEERKSIARWELRRGSLIGKAYAAQAEHPVGAAPTPNEKHR